MSVQPNLTAMEENSALSDLYVVPVDFSNASLNASYYAIELAAMYNVRVKLINTYILPDVRPLSIDDTDFYSGALTANAAEIREEADKKLAAFIVKLKAYIKANALADVAVTGSIINGTPDETTLYTVDSDNATMIIIGISGKDVRTFEPIGKVASRIVEKATIPVLIIPEDTEFREINSIKNILYTTAFDESDFSAISKLIGFNRKLNAKIHCLHIGNVETTPWDKIKMDGLHEYFRKVYDNVNVECDYMISKDLLQVVDEYIVSKNIDVITVNSHKRSLISKLLSSDIAVKFLYHTRIPLLVFHG